MAAGMWGADPDQLNQLGLTLKRQIEGITAVMSAVNACLANTAWTGPAREQFVADWNGSFTTALTRLNQAFEVAGQDCVVRAQGLRVAMANG
jgi:peroxiredoxin